MHDHDNFSTLLVDWGIADCISVGYVSIQLYDPLIGNFACLCYGNI